MNKEHIILNHRPISIASYENYKEAIFLISVLDQPDGYGRIIPTESGEKYCTTIIGYPVVAKLQKNIFGQPVDFGGHELKVETTKDGKKKQYFDTVAIGSVIDAWVEEREVDGYEGIPKCILIKTKLWTSRFPEYFKVFDKLWNEGRVCSSWELTATEVITKGENKIYKVFEFIGNCILGSTKTPAVPGAGVIEYAELDEENDELSIALQSDISKINISNLEQKEEIDLSEKKDNEKLETSIEDVKDSKSTVVAEDTTINDANEPDNDPNMDTASLTDNDLFRKISKACRTAIGCWGYISHWFPEEHKLWFKPDNAPTELDYKLFTYTVENDEITVSDPTDVKLSVSVTEIDTVLAEKDDKIGALTAELEIKDKAVISAGEKINQLNVQISELQPYKEQVEKAEKEKIEAEIAEQKNVLKSNMLKGGLFTEEEISKPDIAELIEARNSTMINSLIAERYIASFDMKSDSDHEEISHEETATASLENEDDVESPSDFMTKFLLKK